MPIAVGDKVYDDEVQYKMDAIGIKPVQETEETPSQTPQTRDRVMTPQQLEQNRAIIRDPNNIYDDQGNIVDYYMPKLQPIPPMQKEGDPLFTPTSSSTMPPGASTEPAGALKPVGGTGIPENEGETSFIRPTPDYLN